jgi:hypothetical protein
MELELFDWLAHHMELYPEEKHAGADADEEDEDEDEHDGDVSDEG